MGTSHEKPSDTDAASVELAQIRAVADLLPQLSWSCLPDGHCDYLSRRWVEYTGVPESRHHGRGWLDSVHPDDRAHTGACWDAFVAGEAEYDVDYRLRRHDGEHRWFKTRGVFVRDSHGAAVRVLGTTTDIDAQKRAEQALRDNQERLKLSEERAELVRSASGVGFWYCDLPFDVLEWDERVKAHFHLPPDARVTIDTFYERIHPDDREPTRQAIARSIAEHTSYDVHYRTVHADTGAETWVRAIGRTFYGPDGTPRRFDGVTLDVTAQRAIEARQRFLADLAAATQSLTEPSDVIAVSARRLAEFLAVDRCAYAEVENESTYVITGDHTHGVASIVGRWEVAAFGAEHLRAMRADEPYVVTDAESDPRVLAPDLEAYRATDIRAVICVPLHKEGHFTAAMAVHQRGPRAWSTDDVELVRTVVGRCWEALERARAARRLRESEEQLRLISDEAPALIAFVDADQRYRFVSRLYEEWFQRPVREMEGKHVREVVGEEAYAGLRAFVERGLAGERFEFEAHAAYPTGRRHIHASFVPRFEGDRVVGYLSLITDVTDRVRAQEELRASERRFREMADTAPVALWLTDPDGSCTFLSREWYELTGQTEEEALGLGWTNATHPDDGARTGQEFLAANAARSTFRTEYRLRAHDGSYRWAIDSGRPRFSEAGEFLGMVGAVFDIEDKKQAEHALRDADKKKDEFLAMLAHELRNPLAPLRNGLQVMRLAGVDGDAAERARAMMDRQLRHMVRLVDDLLDVSRVSGNKMVLRLERVLLADVVSSAVETARPAIDEARHTLSVALPSNPVYLDADLTRLAQVVSNLLMNAAKYTGPGGRIWLSAEASDGQVALTVRDSGIGIPAEALPTVFDMFSQVDRSLERATGGLGIGLALVKGLTEMHGGRVTAASEGLDRGSSFTVALPTIEAVTDGRSPARGEVATARRASSRRVLVVDDNEDAGASLASLLEVLGHEVRTAHDGVEAIAATETFAPDVVLMDVGMPRLNGYEATRRIRAEAWGKSVSIIALTGWGQEGDRAQSQAAGCDAHLVKPVHLDDLVRCLDTLSAR